MIMKERKNLLNREYVNKFVKQKVIKIKNKLFEI